MQTLWYFSMIMLAAMAFLIGLILSTPADRAAARDRVRPWGRAVGLVTLVLVIWIAALEL